MIQRSYPYLLIYEGEIQKVVSVVSSDPCPCLKVYGLTALNEPVFLGTLEDSRLDIDSGKRIVVIWYEYDTSIEDFVFPDSIDIVIDGGYSLRHDNS